MRRGSHVCVVMATAVLFVSAASAAPKKKEAPKPSKLTSAVAKANTLMKFNDEFGEGTRRRIRDSKHLDGKFTCFLTLQDSEEKKDGGLVFDATLRVVRGPPNRYKTAEERELLSGLYVEITSLRSDRRLAIQEFKGEFAHRERCPHINQGDDDHHHHHHPHHHHGPNGETICNGRVLLSAQAYKAGLARIENEFSGRIKSTQREMNGEARIINARLKQEKEMHDRVDVQIAIPAKLAKRINFEKLSKKKRSQWLCRVTEFYGDNESSAAGGKLRIVQLELRAIGVHKSLR